jgi:hypothetical protein
MLCNFFYVRISWLTESMIAACIMHRTMHTVTAEAPIVITLKYAHEFVRNISPWGISLSNVVF